MDVNDASRLFVDLKQVSEAINREVEVVNAEIAAFEKSVFELKLGVSAWLKKPLIESSLTHGALELGWAKHSGNWGLHFRRDDGTGFPQPDPPAIWRVRDGSVEHRILAVNALPDVLVELKAAADKTLRDLLAVTKKSRPGAK